MNGDLIDKLLYEDEGTILDFKRDPYPFEGATDDQKSELLKDVIAFANAWRRIDAYILIGIQEVKGGRSNVVGITDHVDEAKIQQFVNSKTNKPVDFSYHAFTFEGKQIGIVKIPIQDRPIFLVKDYGKLKRDIVYLRRGSSTDIANPDEIARMGAAAISTIPVPIADLQFAHPESLLISGTKLELESRNILIPDETDISETEVVSRATDMSFTNSPSYKLLARYFAEIAKLSPVRLALKNIGPILLNNARLELNVAKQEGFLISRSKSLIRLPGKININFIETDKFWNISVVFGSIPPKATNFSGKFYVSAARSLTVDIEAFVYADNLPDPLRFPLSISVRVQEERITADKIIEIADRNS